MSAHHGHGGHHGQQNMEPPRVEEVADNVFAYIQPDGTWWINNSGFIVSPDGVVTFDSLATERRMRRFLDTVRTVTPAPIRTVVNSHHHGDHTNGNFLTHPATIVAHERCRDLVLATGIQHYEGVWATPQWGHLELAPPTLTFSDRVNVWAGETKIELHYIGTPAHTTNDVVAWIPEHKVLFTGDLIFNGGTPFVVMGSLRGALEALDRLKRFDAEVVVPGHGEVCDMSAIDRPAAYLRFLQEVATDMVASGVEPLEAARSVDLGEFAELTDSERLVGNLHRARLEIAEGAEPGVPIDLVTVFMDMIAFNDGKPLRCAA